MKSIDLFEVNSVNLDFPPWSVPEGWHEIFNNAMTSMREIDPDFEISFFEERFGGLKVNVFASKPELQDRLNLEVMMLEEVSLATCSICGEIGEPRNVGGNLEVYCDDHYKKAKNGQL